VVLLALYGRVTGAQASAQQAAASDSIDLLRRAREAQHDFERIRRANLPSGFDDGGDRCDERIGRYCYWYEPSSASAPPEPEVVGRARERLLRDLATAGRRLPGDGWITGQLVRYLAEHGRAASAVIGAQQCRATRWWCNALEGLARHLARDYEGAEDAFGRALREMPEAQRCAWTDLAPVLGDGGRHYRALPCAERQSVSARIWWLARPLYSRPGNDILTEHYTRHTMALLLEDAETPDGVPWGADRRELLVRFGWPTRWSRSFDRLGSLGPPPVQGHEPSPSFWLFPVPAVAEPWDDVTELHWDPARERPPARYAPPYTAGFAPIERVQFARFRRSDTTLTVAVFDLTSDSVFAGRPLDARLAVARDPATPVAVERVSPVRPLGVLSVWSPWRPAVLSLEAVGVDTPWVARRRAMAPPAPGGSPPVVSDILLFAPAEVLPESLEGALPAALAAPVVQVGQRVGLYWEMYDELGSTAPVEIAVTAMKARWRSDAPYPVGRPWCPFAGEPAVRLRWREEPGARPRGSARAVTLDLRSLSRGRYVVAIQVRVAGQPRGCSSRELRVVGRNPRRLAPRQQVPGAGNGASPALLEPEAWPKKKGSRSCGSLCPSLAQMAEVAGLHEIRERVCPESCGPPPP
jgi:hypothetical protein